MKAQNIYHSEVLSIKEGESTATKLPVGITYGEIRVFVKGTYTLGTGVLHADSPKNCFRNMKLEYNNANAIYGAKSKDIRVMNYYDQLGLEHFSAAAGKFEALFRFNKGMLLADESVLPNGHGHPFGKITQLNLDLTWMAKADFFSTVGTATIDTAKAHINYEQIDITKEEVKALFGDQLERYALPRVTAKQSGNIAVNTELSEVLNIGSGNLHKRGFMTTLDQAATPAEQDDRVQKYQIKQTLPASAAKDLITSRYDAAQADDKSYYGLSALLKGVVAIDYNAEVAKDGRGIIVESKEEALKLLAMVDNVAILRYLSEEYVVNRDHVLKGGPVVFGV